MRAKERLIAAKKLLVPSWIGLVLAILFILISIIKGIYFWSSESNIPLVNAINNGSRWLIEVTWFQPFEYIWQVIPATPFESKKHLDFLRVIVPPGVIGFICAFFISDYKAAKAKFAELKAEVDRGRDLEELQKEAGVYELDRKSTIDVIVSNKPVDIVAWHNTWWGKIVIGIAIVSIAAVIGVS